jgi:hypothetical protein
MLFTAVEPPVNETITKILLDVLEGVIDADIPVIST